MKYERLTFPPLVGFEVGEHIDFCGVRAVVTKREPDGYFEWRPLRWYEWRWEDFAAEFQRGKG